MSTDWNVKAPVCSAAPPFGVNSADDWMRGRFASNKCPDPQPLVTRQLLAREISCFAKTGRFGWFWRVDHEPRYEEARRPNEDRRSTYGGTPPVLSIGRPKSPVESDPFQQTASRGRRRKDESEIEGFVKSNIQSIYNLLVVRYDRRTSPSCCKSASVSRRQWRVFTRRFVLPILVRSL